MSIRAVVDLIAMLACSVYCTIPVFWLALHPFVGRWRKRGRRAYRVIVPIWGLMIGVAFVSAWRFRLVHLYTNWVAWALAATLFVLGFRIYAAAFRSFDHTQLSGLDELEPGRHRDRLVTTGIRTHVRHPIYLGHLCEVLAWCIAAGLVALYALACFGIFAGMAMVRIEDRELEARFGEEYRRYRRAVPAVIPRT
jgi:protein-S-isoprenylcysteine O-methyltransferase Ste14